MTKYFQNRVATSLRWLDVSRVTMSVRPQTFPWVRLFCQSSSLRTGWHDSPRETSHLSGMFCEVFSCGDTTNDGGGCKTFIFFCLSNPGLWWDVVSSISSILLCCSPSSISLSCSLLSFSNICVNVFWVCGITSHLCFRGGAGLGSSLSAHAPGGNELQWHHLSLMNQVLIRVSKKDFLDLTHSEASAQQPRHYYFGCLECCWGFFLGSKMK